MWDSRYDVLEWVRNEYRDIPREADVLIGMGCRTVTEKDVITEAFAGELGLDGTAAGTDAAAFDTRHTLNTGFYHALSYTFVWAPEAGENTAEHIAGLERLISIMISSIEPIQSSECQ